MLRVIAILAGLAAGLLLARRAEAQTGEGGAVASWWSIGASSVSSFDEFYRKHGAAFGVDWRLTKAIAQHESSENPDAVNHDDNESLGLMQVFCRPDGAGGCSNKL